MIDLLAFADSIRARAAAYIGWAEEDPHTPPQAAPTAPVAPQSPRPTSAPRSWISGPPTRPQPVPTHAPGTGPTDRPDSLGPIAWHIAADHELAQLADLTTATNDPWQPARLMDWPR